MPKTLLVYFSHTGFTRTVAEELMRLRDCDVEEIRELTPRRGWLGYLRAGFEALTKKQARIVTPARNPDAYELTIIGGPVWAGHVSSPVRAYVKKLHRQFGQVAWFITYGGSGAEQMLAELTDVAGRAPIATLALKDSEIEAGAFTDKLKGFAQELASGTQRRGATKAAAVSVR
jgi:flavodoxin